MSKPTEEVKKELDTQRKRHNSAQDRIKHRHELQQLYIEKKEQEDTPIPPKTKVKHQPKHFTF